MALSRQTLKVDRDSLQNLRLIAAYTGEKQYQVIDRLLTKELRVCERRTRRRAQQKADREAEARRQRLMPVPREFYYPFPADWHYINIPAIEHEFQTNALSVQVFVNTDTGLQKQWPYELECTPVHAVKIALVAHEGSTTQPHSARVTLLSHHGGTIVITGLEQPKEIRA